MDLGLLAVSIALVLVVGTLAYSHSRLAASNQKLVQHVISFQNPYAAQAYQAQVEAEHQAQVAERLRRKDLNGAEFASGANRLEEEMYGEPMD